MATITQLRTFGPVLAKRWHRGADGELVKTGYDGAKHFAVTLHEATSLGELARALDTISRDPRSCIIRGRPKPATDLARTWRRLEMFFDAGQTWIPVDFDDTECPSWLDWRAEPAAAAAYLRSLLPPEFHEAGCWWCFTGSQGFKPGLCMRLVFLCDLPLTCAEVKRWLGERQPDASKAKAQWPKLYPVDPSLYGAVQPIYVAAPVFGQGIDDLVPVRSGVLPGRFEAVPAPWPIVPRYGAVVVQEAAAKSAALPKEHIGSGYLHHRERIGDHDEFGFHEPIRAALGAFFAQHGSKADPAYVLLDLKAAALAAPRRPGSDREADVAKRIAALPSVAEWTRAQQAKSERQKDAIGAPCPAPVALPTLSLAEAEAALGEATATVFAESRRFFRWGELFYDPPRAGVGAGIGLGKTEAAIREIVRLVEERPELRIAFAAPTHRTGDDIAARLNAPAGRRIAATWRGVEQPDPSRPGCTMCRVPELVKRVRASGGGVRDVCGGDKRGWCPHNPNGPEVSAADACGYRQQRGSSASVWVVPHSMLSSAPPSSLGAIDMLVIDEAPWLTLFGGCDVNAPVRVTLAELLQLREVDGRTGLGSIQYADAVARLRRALDGQDGLLRRAALADAGLDTFVARRCASVVWASARKPAIQRDLSEAEAVAAFDADLAEARPVHLVSKAWHLIADFLESGEAVAPETLRIETDGAGERCLRLRWRADIHRGWRAGPILYLDATVIPEIAQLWLPGLQVAATVRARETAVHRIQVFDRQNGKTGLVGSNDAKADERRRKHDALRRLIEALAFIYRGQGAPGGADVLVLTYKALVPALRRGMPENVAFGHFSAARGFDGWRGVRVVLVIGRPLPAQRDVAMLAAVASGRLGEAFGSDYALDAPAGLLMRDGTGRRVVTTAHLDPLADAFRRQVLTEVEQAEGRARGVRRTAERPLLSMMLTAHATMLPIDEAVTQSDLLDSVGLLMLLAARGIVPGNAHDAAQTISDVFEGEADRAAAFRARLSRMGAGGLLERIIGGSGPASAEPVTPPYRGLYTVASQVRGKQAEPAPESFRTFRAYRYRRADCRKSSVALIDIQRHSDPRAALSAAVGDLASFERTAAPDWLANVQHELTYVRPGQVFRPAPSAFTAILGTDYRNVPATPQLLPVAEDILSVTRRGERVTLHFYGAPHGTPLILIRTANASWPPRRKPAAERLFSAADVAAVVGVPWPRVRDMMADIRAQERADTVGFERAAVEALSRFVGADRVGAAVADLKRRSAHNSREGSR